MKIKIHTGATLNEATLNLVKSVDNSDLEVEHLVIVPDRFSLLMERLLLKNLPSKAMFNVSVHGLSSLATKLLDEIGAGSVNTITMADALLLTSQAINNVKEQLVSFKKSNINFCHEIYKAISQFKSCSVEPKDLNIKNATVAQQKKYHDLALIFEEYERLLDGRLDANGLLDYFNISLTTSQILKNKIIYFAQFDSFTQKTYELIKTIARNANEVHFAIAQPLSPSNAYIYEDDILYKLKDLATKEKIMIEVESPKEGLLTPASAIAKNLYGFKINNVENNDFLTLVASQSVHEEVELIGKIIRYRIFKGARYKDFAVACSNLEKYSKIIEKIFLMLDIPYYIDQSVTADKTLLAMFLSKILNVFVKDFSRESLQELSSELILNLQNRENLCKLINSHNIFGKNRYKKLLAQNCKELDELITLFDKENYKDLVEACKLAIEKYSSNYQSILDKLKDKALVKQYNINAQAKEIIIDALDKILLYKGDQQCTKNEFLKHVNLILSFKEVSSVPTYVDAVMVGDATNSFFGQIKNLIIIGGEGLPTYSSDSGLVCDDDIKSLSIIKRIEPSIRMVNRRNRFKLFNLLCSAENSLLISYLNLNDEGKKVEMPTYIDSLSKIFNSKVLDPYYFYIGAGQNLDVDNAKKLLSIGSRKMAIERGIIQLEEMERKSVNVSAHRLFFPQEYTKVTQLECYFDCPFKHFVRYGLRAVEPEKYEFDAREIGNICHKLAEKFVNLNKNSLASLSDDDIKKFIDKNLILSIEEEGLEDKLNCTIDKDGLLDYLYRIAIFVLSRIVFEQKKSGFKPLYLEKNLETILKYNNKQIRLIGKIDRVDVAGDYYRIMDYKTGQVDPLIKDLYYGDKLQLFLYSSATGESLHKKPSGVFYFDARWDYDLEDKKEVILKGIVANDDEVLPLYDSSEGASEVIALNNKNGEYKGSALAKFPLKTFEDYARAVSTKALSEIDEGYIEPKPDQFSCGKCSYKSICLYSEKGYRKKDKVSQEDIAFSGGKNA